MPERDPSPVRRPGSKEIATLEVRGTLFTNWTSVRVDQRITEAFPTFTFECSEESPMPLKYDALQFTPGDVVRVFVGGVDAVFGYIQERHVAFDARSHAVRLIGVGDTFDLVSSHVPLEKISGHDGKTWTQLAKDLSEHLGTKIASKGAVDNKPFENIHVQPGDKIMDVLERYGRMRAIVIGSLATGGLLAIGDHPAIPAGDLVEGYNILRASVAVRDNNTFKRLYTVGQGNGSDQSHGDQQNKQVATETGSSTRNRYSVTVADIADTMHGIQRRVMMEKIFTEGSIIEAQITVQGWFKDNNNSDEVWRAGEYYTVDSPSLIMKGKVLGCAGCSYEQSNSGTTTTLQLVNPLHMNGKLNYRNAQATRRLEDAARARLGPQLPDDMTL